MDLIKRIATKALKHPEGVSLKEKQILCAFVLGVNCK